MLRTKSSRSAIPVPHGTPDEEDVGHVSIGATQDSTASAFVLRDGRVDIQLTDKASRLTRHLEETFRQHTHLGQALTRNNRHYDTEFQSVLGKYAGLPRLNIAIHIVGSRGDVQPFIAIGQVLAKPPYSHRIRICTHPVFKDFVEENGLEFFSIGGDPTVLMAYMVKNPGLMPGKESWKAGDVGKRRADIAEILEGCWRSCLQPGNGMGGEGRGADQTARTDDADRLFVADAIIANPPSYAHIHCAEKLGIPLHMMFTMPWSPTQYFPHPLASIERNDSDPNFANYISYTLMELLAWQGLGDVINGFRTKTLHLDPVSPLWGHMLLSRMKVPFTYAWSSALIPKPRDWASYINITGFAFLLSPSSYKPPEDLVEFLKAGSPPVYIGFGSIVIDKPNELTDMIFRAVKRAGVRALVSKGWGGLGGESPPEGVFLLGNCPHDWLFQHVSCVVHHGGAGTSAIGIAMGKPTVVVPFFGDQPFWGAMIHRAGAGPEPVPYKKMTAEILANSITKALGPEIKTAVKEMSDKIAHENGARDAAASFHQAVDLDSMKCILSPENVAVWRIKNTKLRLSSIAAATLADNGLLTLHDLKLVRHRDWYIDEGASSPFLGALGAVSGTITNTFVSIRDYSNSMSKTVHKRPEQKSSKPTTPEPEPEEPFAENLGQVVSRFPVQAAAKYPPQHLEALAYRMAAKNLPNRKDRAKHRKTYSWSPGQRIPKKKPSQARQAHHDHGRLHDATFETGHFARSIVGTGLKAPIEFFYNIANGFHNAPSFLFHDSTVRRRDNITGLGSGVKVAAKGFTFNLFDGVTGIVTHPYREARKDGVAGFGKGIGKGVGGLLFKSTAAVIGIPAYTLKGLERQIERRHDRDLRAKILETRFRQGVATYSRASEQEKEEIIRRWKELGYVL